MTALEANPSATATPAPRKATVLYDGNCRFCCKSVAILQGLDWLKRFDCRNCRDLENLPPCAVPLDPQRLLDEMHVVTPDGRRAFAGFSAFRWMAWRMPATWLLAPLLYFPGVPWLGNKAYLWVARNRFKLIPCRDGVCELPRPVGKM